jgi:hypothetical protein
MENWTELEMTKRQVTKFIKCTNNMEILYLKNVAVSLCVEKSDDLTALTSHTGIDSRLVTVLQLIVLTPRLPESPTLSTWPLQLCAFLSSGN